MPDGSWPAADCVTVADLVALAPSDAVKVGVAAVDADAVGDPTNTAASNSIMFEEAAGLK